MYPQQQGITTNSPNYGSGTIPPPPLSGIASRVGDLQKAASELQNLAYEVKGALGIAGPGTDAKSTALPSSLADVLTDVYIRITKSNADLQDVISHLNS